MGKHLRRVMSPLGVILVVLFVLGYRGGAFGVPLDQLEEFSRTHQPIPEEWVCLDEAEGDIAVLLFYPEDQSNASYVIYVKGKGLAFGFYARSRGFMHAIQEGICEYQYGERDTAIFLSMNKPDVRFAEIRYDDGETDTVTFRADQPFALLLPLTAEVVFYGDDGPLAPTLRSVVAI